MDNVRSVMNEKTEVGFNESYTDYLDQPKFFMNNNSPALNLSDYFSNLPHLEKGIHTFKIQINNDTEFEMNITIGNDTEVPKCSGVPDDARNWMRVCEGILCPIFGICGLFGNLMTIFILLKQPFKKKFYRLIISLLLYDIMYIGKNKTYEKRCLQYQ